MQKTIEPREWEQSPATDPMIGRVIDSRYLLTKRLGAGGMGVVYAARHEVTGREVAIKLLHVNGHHTDEALARFAREARTASATGHPNIVEVLDAGTLPDRTAFLVMEQLHGEALGHLLWRETRLTPRRVADVISQAAHALEALHAQGVVHRDVKTDNLFIEHGGRVKLLDFGLAVFTDGRVSRLTQDGVFNGTPQYMPPEVFDGGEPSIAWDVYALATVAFELLTGAVPFEDANPIVMLYGKRESVAPRLADRANVRFSDELERVIRKGLERDPSRRHPSPLSFAEHLSRAAAASERPQIEDGPVLLLTSPSRSSQAGARARVVSRSPREIVRALSRPWRPLTRGAIAVAACFVVLLAAWMTFAQSDDVPLAPPPAKEAGAQATIARTSPTSAAVREELPLGLEPPVETAVVTTAAVEERRSRRSRRHEHHARTTTVVFTAEDHAAPVRASTSPHEPSNVGQLVREGTAALMRGMIPDAIDMLHRATLESPQSSSAWRGLGLANERMGRRAEARRAYARYLALAPSAPDADEVRRRIESL